MQVVAVQSIEVNGKLLNDVIALARGGSGYVLTVLIGLLAQKMSATDRAITAYTLT